MDAGAVVAGRYRLDRRLAMGGMGEIWQGRDLTLPRDVAVKLLLDPDPDSGALKRFGREASIAAGLQHPGITVVYDAGLDDGRRFIVMEFLRGTNLRTVLAAAPDGLGTDRALDFGIQIADALVAAHEAGIVHRDLKPDNLMVLPGDRIKVCDFGIARDLTASTITSPGDILGTPPYVAPEQWLGGPVTAAADLYALGCILTQLLSGRRPVEAASLVAYMNAHLTQEPLPLRTVNPEISGELSDFVLTLLAKDPAQRPPDAVAVRSALTRIRDRGRAAYTPTVTVPSLPLATPMAVGRFELGRILWAADQAGALRSAQGLVRTEAWSRLSRDDEVPLGPVTAIAAAYNYRDISAVALVAGGVPYVSLEKGFDPWHSLCEGGSGAPLRLPVTEIALTQSGHDLAVHAVDSANTLRARWYDAERNTWTPWKQTESPVAGRITAIAIDTGGVLDVVATAEGRVCYRSVVFEATQADLGRPIADVAYVCGLSKMHAVIFALDDTGTIWQKWDWLRDGGRVQSGWLALPSPPGRVTGIVADRSLVDIYAPSGMLLAASADDAIHQAMFTPETTGHLRWSPWTRLAA
jgi:hypothetical protein